MVIDTATGKKVLLLLFKDYSRTHTITSLAQDLNLSRVGMWKILKRLESKKYVFLDAVGRGKTSTAIIKINWGNVLVEKTLSLYLTEEAVKQRRWRVNFAGLEGVVDFLVLYGSIIYSSQANDIDIVGVAQKRNFVRIQNIIDNAQKTQSKKIHAINFTKEEFRRELLEPNRAFLDAVRKGVVLFGQEAFIAFMRRLRK
jgi:DNA-binding Lrp family transcriptional regulator